MEDNTELSALFRKVNSVSGLHSYSLFFLPLPQTACDAFPNHHPITPNNIHLSVLLYSVLF